MTRQVRTLLVVDNSATSLFYWSMLLRRLKYKVVSRRSADEALKVLETDPPDLVLTEAALPGTDGAALLKAIKADRRFRDIPVVMLTASNDALLRSACERFGCAAWFRKDAEPDDLYQKVQSLIEATPRSHIRLNTSVKVIVGDGTAMGGIARTEYASAISEGGIYVRTQYPQPKNTLVISDILTPVRSMVSPMARPATTVVGIDIPSIASLPPTPEKNTVPLSVEPPFRSATPPAEIMTRPPDNICVFEVAPRFAAATNPPASSTNGAVWSNGFALVWHLKETNFPYADSAQHYPGTIGTTPVSATGAIGKAVRLNGNSAFISPGSVILDNAFTLSAWVNVTNTANSFQTVWANKAGNTNAGFALCVNNYANNDQALVLETGDGADFTKAKTDTNLVTFGQWHLVNAVVDRALGTARWTDCLFDASTLFVEFTDSVFERCSFRVTTFRGLSGEYGGVRARFVGCDFSRAILRALSLRACKFESCDFTDTRLLDCDLRGATHDGRPLENNG